MIVSDSTALITLINIDEFELLYLFKQSILIPKEVYYEVCIRKEAKVFLDEQIEKKFVALCEHDNDVLFDELRMLLDSGESASIVLALEKRVPLIIDEKKGRQVAENMGIAIVGLIGMIKFLYKKESISKKRTQEILKKLSASNFRLSKKLMNMVLES